MNATAKILAFDVHGTPAPQGSHRAFVNKHTGRVNVIHDSNWIAPWRKEVVQAARRAITEQGVHFPTGPVVAEVFFYVKRPRSHYGTGRNAGVLKPSAPLWPDSRPDSDKYLRSVYDALTEAGAWGDDGQVVMWHGAKMYADTRPAGAHIRLFAPIENEGMEP